MMIALMGGNPRGTMTYSILTTRTRLMRRETAIVGDITWEHRQAHMMEPCQVADRSVRLMFTAYVTGAHTICMCPDDPI